MKRSTSAHSCSMFGITERRDDCVILRYCQVFYSLEQNSKVLRWVLLLIPDPLLIYIFLSFKKRNKRFSLFSFFVFHSEFFISSSHFTKHRRHSIYDICKLFVNRAFFGPRATFGKILSISSRRRQAPASRG